MQVDSVLALIEKKLIDLEKESLFTKKRSVRDVKNNIENLGFVEIERSVFQFEKKYYFEEKIPMIQMKYNYLDQYKENNHIWLFQRENLITQRFWLYGGHSNDINDWVRGLENRYSGEKWKFIVEKEKNIKEMHYYCYSLKTNAQEFYNIIFHINIENKKIRGIFNCLYKDKYDFGILLEALLLLFYENAAEEWGGE